MVRGAAVGQAPCSLSNMPIFSYYSHSRGGSVKGPLCLVEPGGGLYSAAHLLHQERSVPAEHRPPCGHGRSMVKLSMIKSKVPGQVWMARCLPAVSIQSGGLQSD